MSRRELTPSRRTKGAVSLRDTAHEAIKLRIITCALKPGEYVNELQLSEMLEIGRTPVHQALNRLMLEGLVEVIPRKGVIVKPVSLNEVLHILEVRTINECYCARLAAERANDQDIAEISGVLKRAARWLSARNTKNLMLIDREFHSLVVRAAKNDVVAELVRSLHERSLRLWFLMHHTPKQYATVHEQHEAIFDAISKHDPDKAEAATRQHIETFRANICQFF
jgi:DNA-binding GntR family transcriptional regulator